MKMCDGGLPRRTSIVFFLIAGMMMFAETNDTVFSVGDLPAGVVARITGVSYREGCPVGLGDLRYLRLSHHGFEGDVKVGEMICHKDVAERVRDVFRELYLYGYRIERMVLVDEYGGDDELSMRANNTSCFNFRRVAGSVRLSKHALGKAVDINPLYNPYVREVSGGRCVLQPSTAGDYVKRDGGDWRQIRRGDVLYRLMTAAGFKWGGDWRRYKDYQHFEAK